MPKTNMASNIRLTSFDDLMNSNNDNADNLENVIVVGSFSDNVKAIKKLILSTAQNHCAIGYYLKQIRDHEQYKDVGYNNIWEISEAEFGWHQTTTFRCIQMNDKYSEGGNSPNLDPKYREFSKSKLQEMLYLPDNLEEKVTADMTVKEIRSLRPQNSQKQEPKQEDLVDVDEDDEPTVGNRSPIGRVAVSDEEKIMAKKGQDHDLDDAPLPGQMNMIEYYDEEGTSFNGFEEEAPALIAALPEDEESKAESSEISVIATSQVETNENTNESTKLTENERRGLEDFIETQKPIFEEMKDNWQKANTRLYYKQKMAIKACELLLEFHSQ